MRYQQDIVAASFWCTLQTRGNFTASTTPSRLANFDTLLTRDLSAVAIFFCYIKVRMTKLRI